MKLLYIVLDEKRRGERPLGGRMGLSPSQLKDAGRRWKEWRGVTATITSR
ncbi:MAG: hypothetical protein ACMUJM_22270 [bacterium]